MAENRHPRGYSVSIDQPREPHQDAEYEDKVGEPFSEILCNGILCENVKDKTRERDQVAEVPVPRFRRLIHTFVDRVLSQRDSLCVVLAERFRQSLDGLGLTRQRGRDERRSTMRMTTFEHKLENAAASGAAAHAASIAVEKVNKSCMRTSLYRKRSATTQLAWWPAPHRIQRWCHVSNTRQRDTRSSSTKKKNQLARLSGNSSVLLASCQADVRKKTLCALW